MSIMVDELPSTQVKMCGMTLQSYLSGDLIREQKIFMDLPHPSNTDQNN